MDQTLCRFNQKDEACDPYFFTVFPSDLQDG